MSSSYGTMSIVGGTMSSSYGTMSTISGTKSYGTMNIFSVILNICQLSLQKR